MAPVSWHPESANQNLRLKCLKVIKVKLRTANHIQPAGL